MELFRYFVHYTYVNKNGNHGDGNMVSILRVPIDDIKTINQIQDSVKEEFDEMETVVIDNIIPLPIV